MKNLYIVRIKIKGNEYSDSIYFKTFNYEEAEKKYDEAVKLYSKIDYPHCIIIETYLYEGNKKIASDIAVNECFIPQLKEAC